MPVILTRPVILIGRKPAEFTGKILACSLYCHSPVVLTVMIFPMQQIKLFISVDQAGISVDQAGSFSSSDVVDVNITKMQLDQAGIEPTTFRL